MRNGLCIVASPFAKRFALSALSLRAASLPSISPLLAARLSGNWVSALLYRRCIASVVDDFFALSAGLEKPGAEKVVPLKRKCAEELVLLSVLCPLMFANVAADFPEELYVSDASIQKGAVVSGAVSRDSLRALWQSTEKRGHYTVLEDPLRARLKHLVDELELPEELPAWEGGVNEKPFKPPLLIFDFVEVCGGAGVVSKQAANLGLVVAPVLDLSDSAHYDLRNLRFLEWVCHMIATGRFRSFLIEPPCTSFSAAAHPSVRSYKQPLGYDRKEKKTLHGNILSFRSFVMLKVGHRHKRPCGLEQPFLSKMAWLTFWQTMLALGFSEHFIASCMFGSIHKKQFRFLLFLIDDLTVLCEGGHQHVKIEGKWTKGSATYVEGLALHVAKGFQRALRRDLARGSEEPEIFGFESVLANEIMQSTAWRLEKVWSWKRKSHINVLESFSSVSALGTASQRNPDSRLCLGVDSQVSKGALSKGRSSAKSLQPQTKRACAIQLAFGTFPVWFFSPTRLNTADAPTRDRPLPSPTQNNFLALFSPEELADLHFVGLRRFAANWIRLVILIQVVQPASAWPHACEIRPAHALFGTSLGFWIFSSVGLVLALICGFWIFNVLWIFSSFASAIFTPLRSLGSIALGSAPRLGGFRHVVLALLVCHAVAMEPSNAAERARASLRSHVFLPADRVVKKETRARRLQLLSEFRTWLWKQHRVSLRSLLNQKVLDAEKISHWLVVYGREMYAAGKSYGRFSETINSLAMTKPLLKKQLTPAWDLCFSWLADEPHQHHPALPASILLAMLTTALCWGWPFEAAVIALAWAGVCRIGEVLQAKRDDLILPQDAAPGNLFVLLRIADPKTRGRSARHQSARVDQEDIVRLLIAVYGKCSAADMLWPLSASTLRSRFTNLLKALELPTSSSGKARCFDLASLRPGGATYILNMTESTELVRRRGRWLSQKVCDIYLQEVQVATYLHRLAPSQREKIQTLASIFPAVLQKAIHFLDTGIPPAAWYLLMKVQRTDTGTERAGGSGQWKAERPDFPRTE